MTRAYTRPPQKGDKIIYAILCVPTGQTYIGQTTQSIRGRWKHHRQEKTSSPLQTALRRWGFDSFEVVELLYCAAEHADIFEAELIKIYRAHVSQGGLNRTWGYWDNSMNYSDSLARARAGGYLGAP